MMQQLVWLLQALILFYAILYEDRALDFDWLTMGIGNAQHPLEPTRNNMTQINQSSQGALYNESHDCII
jgi:hypothetical protein